MNIIGEWNRETVRTYELNLLVTGGWLSALANIRAGTYGDSLS
ncbi:MAG: hypothetical protein ABIV48_09880 [Pyrinomonadaceae bacterium]